MQDESSKNTGPTSDDGMTSEPFRLETENAQPLGRPFHLLLEAILEADRLPIPGPPESARLQNERSLRPMRSRTGPLISFVAASHVSP
jgi:hypothetical protein